MSGTCIAADNLSVVTKLALYEVNLLIWHKFEWYLRRLRWANLRTLSPLGVWQGYWRGKKSVVCVFDVGLSLGILW